MSSLRLSPLARSKAITRGQRVAIRSYASANDLVITNGPGTHTPQPVIKKGPPTGGRSASSGHRVTVFGCTGFLGRYLVAKLGKQGCQVIVPYRDEDEKRHLKVTGDLGQIVMMEWDARRPEQTHECMKHSDTVYNLVGRDWETRNYKYEDVNVTAAQSIASIATETGVSRLIHVSHLNASPNSPSEFYRSKYHGERVVRDAFPEATIVRPGPLFGSEDWLLNAMAQYPILFKLNQGRTRILPVHVVDVASALETMLYAPLTSVASTFALPGPQPFTYAELLRLVGYFIMKPVPNQPDVTKPVAKLIATLLNRGIWWPTISPDEIERRYIDDAVVDQFYTQTEETKPSGWGEQRGALGMKGIDGEDLKGWKELDIEPALVEEHAVSYLRRYRSSGDFDAPIEIGQLRPPKRYHVVP